VSVCATNRRNSLCTNGLCLRKRSMHAAYPITATMARVLFRLPFALRNRTLIEEGGSCSKQRLIFRRKPKRSWRRCEQSLWRIGTSRAPLSGFERGNRTILSFLACNDRQTQIGPRVGGNDAGRNIGTIRHFGGDVVPVGNRFGYESDVENAGRLRPRRRYEAEHLGRGLAILN